MSQVNLHWFNARSGLHGNKIPPNYINFASQLFRKHKKHNKCFEVVNNLKDHLSKETHKKTCSTGNNNREQYQYDDSNMKMLHAFRKRYYSGDFA